MSYTPEHDAPETGEWVRTPTLRWSQNHSALVAAALRSWSGHPVEMRLHLDDVAADAPQPGSGGGKIMRAQAEALAWELQHNARPSKGTLYRGSHVEPRGLQSWTSRKKVATLWAGRNHGRVWTLPKGTPGLRRLDYASTAFDEEAEWLVLLPGERGERF